MQYVISVALSFLNTPYLWNGKHVSQGGLDCSGLVSNVLMSVGFSELKGVNSQGIYEALIKRPGTQIQVRKPGAVAFFGKDLNSITHVSLLIDQHRMIESGGGDSTYAIVDPIQQAARYSGVRIRLLTHRKDLIAVLMPSYACIGLI